MEKDWEATFSKWSLGPSDTEQARADNTVKMIKSAIENSPKLKNRNITTFLQGSYRNRVNVRTDSDVDVGVLCFDSFFPYYQDDNIKVRLEKSFSDSTYVYSQFKNEIEEALVTKFGRQNVKRGRKAFDIHENSYHVEADVVAFFEHRRYISDTNYYSGVQMLPDDGNPPRIINWPEQHYQNGVQKNNLTARFYKRQVRIIKALCNEMNENQIKSAENIPGFLLECLVWNVPNDNFDARSFYNRTRYNLAWLFNNTIHDSDCEEWGEVSELKYLFKGSNYWTRESVHSLLSDAWKYVGYAD